MDQENVAEVPVWYGGVEKWITGIHKRTTCDDVVRAIISAQMGRNKKSVDGTKDYNNYVLVERWHKVEKPLDGKAKILKLWSKWGEEQCNVKLSLKKLQQPQLKDTTNIRHGRRHHHNHQKSSKSLHPKKLSTDGSTVGMTETVDRLMKLIMSQTETISYQLGKLLDKDKKIEDYETQIHELRMTQIGTNYVQDAYLPDKSNTSKTTSENSLESQDSTNQESPDAETTPLSPDETEHAIEMYQKILDLCLRLETEENNILTLESELKEVRENPVHEDSDESDNERVVAEVIQLKSELDRLNALFMTRENVLGQNSRFIVDSDRTINEKQRTIDQLELDLMNADRQTEQLRYQYEVLMNTEDSKYNVPRIEHTSTLVSPISCKGETESLDSDTGLSSLHSSSDEGAYVLDTLV